jgi:hypothetical protein
VIRKLNGLRVAVCITSGLILSADAHNDDPEELPVLDTSLSKQLVLGYSSPNAPRHTEGSLQMTPSLCLDRTQQSDI